jgi:hypothetical protein
VVIDNRDMTACRADGPSCVEWDLVPDTASEGPVMRVPIGDVGLGESPRLGQVSLAHLKVMAELAGAWAPLLISRSGRIVDGHYRYLAAHRLNHTHVDCVVFRGPDSDAFVEAVRRNVTQGLPLTLPERKKAAARIVADRPGWSDRKIAELCGLTHKTVGRLRQDATCLSGEIHQLDARQGRDGKSRAVNPLAVRTRIIEAIEQEPGASLRHLARMSGSTHETVRAVRRRMQQAPPPPGRGVAGNQLKRSPVNPSGDAAFTSTEAGASFAEWFEQTSITPGWVNYLESVPLSRVYEIEDEAHRRATAWLEFAAALASRANRRSS